MSLERLNTWSQTLLWGQDASSRQQNPVTLAHTALAEL
jgi:hypothetical protein